MMLAMLRKEQPEPFTVWFMRLSELTCRDSDARGRLFAKGIFHERLPPRHASRESILLNSYRFKFLSINPYPGWKRSFLTRWSRSLRDAAPMHIDLSRTETKRAETWERKISRECIRRYISVSIRAASMQIRPSLWWYEHRHDWASTKRCFSRS
jgi:hypothetical protein